jgi:hypothetical protein
MSVDLRERAEVGKQLSGRIPSRLLLRKLAVHWTMVDEKGLSEPFFHQTIERLHKTNAPDIVATSVNALLRTKEELRPNGFIFHISRCGSTLLANAMRSFSGSTVISESNLISKALLLTHDIIQLNGESVTRDDLLRGLIRAYGRRLNAQSNSLVFKMSSWNVLHVGLFRKLWPTVPIIMVIRDPLEVGVSLVDGAPGWLEENRANQIVNADIKDQVAANELETVEARCACVLREYLKAVLLQSFDPLSRVIDYKDLSPSTALEMGQFFKMPGVDSLNHQALETTFSTYSKDPSASRAYSDDTIRKQTSASSILREEINNRARPVYEELSRKLEKGKSISIT